MKEKMKFDVVVGNPPFKGRGDLHLKFLNLAYKLSSGYIVWIHPSTWILDERGTNKKYEYTKKLIKDNIVNLTFFNGNPIFDVKLFVPFVIEFIDKNNNNKGQIKVFDKLNQKQITYQNIEEINKWGDIKIYPILKNKILKLCEEDNLNNHDNKKEGSWYVNLSLLRGNVELKSPQKMVKNDFYTFFPKDPIKPSREIQEKFLDRTLFWSFKSEEEATNFINFLKTRWAMFSLSIFKNNQHFLFGNAIESVPWLNWSEPWTEERFEKLINATPEEIEFVHKNIPDYYHIAND